MAGLRSMRVTVMWSAVRRCEMFAFRTLVPTKIEEGILVDIWTRALVGSGQFGSTVSLFSAMTKKRVKLASGSNQVTRAALAVRNTPVSSWIPSWRTDRPSNNVPHIFEHIAAQSGGLWRSACAAAAVDVVFAKETDGKWLAMKVWHWPSAFQNNHYNHWHCYQIGFKLTCSWLIIFLISSSFTPCRTSRQCCTCNIISPRTNLVSGLRRVSYVSMTLPKVEFSWGTTPKSAVNGTESKTSNIGIRVCSAMNNEFTFDPFSLNVFSFYTELSVRSLKSAWFYREVGNLTNWLTSWV